MRSTAIFLLALAAPGLCQDVDFFRDIEPILAENCTGCHGSITQKAGLRLDQRAAFFAGSSFGEDPVVQPGDHRISLLHELVASTDLSERMPPEDKAGLSAKEIELLARWIDAGAPWPDDGEEAVWPAQHWAYQAPQMPAVPDLADFPESWRDWPANPVDRFLLVRMLAAGVEPAPPAEKSQWLRRASLDLTGLPPGVADLDAILKGDPATAWDAALDELLASRHYGEQQALGWLDLARYADSNGYEKDAARNIWPYRDWVIDAFNQDLGFDEFTVKQLAGDLLPNATQADRIATGFHRNTMLNDEGGVDDEEFRVAAVQDRTDTTGLVWLGSTMGCAQCHNHKYDPITHRDYYGLFAFFNQTADGGKAEPPVLEVQTPAAKRLREKHFAMVQSVLQSFGSSPRSSRRKSELKRAIGKLRQPVTTMVLEKATKPRRSFVLGKGSFLSPGDEVQPSIPSILRSKHVQVAPDRLGLARWLVGPGNPLAARAEVNRVWQQVFGRGLVPTVDDFGSQGKQPSHPQLLDWLALEFVEHGWSRKWLLKTLLSTAAYAQSAQRSKAAAILDPQNRLLSHFPRVRMRGENLRDLHLFVSGLWNAEVGGPSVFPPQPAGIDVGTYAGDRWVTSTGPDRYRRGLYTFLRRTSPYPSFVMFGTTSRELACARRDRANTPLQALVLLNDPAFVETAEAFAGRMGGLAGVSDVDRMRFGFRACTGREPGTTEILRLAELLVQEGWSSVARVLLNMDETLNRG